LLINTIGQPERATQDRVIALFRDELDYPYLGDWTDRADNSNIEEGLLSAYLTRCGYRPAQITNPSGSSTGKLLTTSQCATSGGE
jgi:type I restriction enzyme R subunit